jgi:hypothetical protein
MDESKMFNEASQPSQNENKADSIINTPEAPQNNKANFWDFKTKMNYENASDKRADFLFGFFGLFLVSTFFPFLFVPLLGGKLMYFLFAFIVFTIIYLFNRRRFISYGIISSILFGMLLAFLSGLVILLTWH